jgi:hypothetical protein
MRFKIQWSSERSHRVTACWPIALRVPWSGSQNSWREENL